MMTLRVEESKLETEAVNIVISVDLIELTHSCQAEAFSECTEPIVVVTLEIQRVQREATRATGSALFKVPASCGK